MAWVAGLVAGAFVLVLAGLAVALRLVVVCVFADGLADVELDVVPVDAGFLLLVVFVAVVDDVFFAVDFAAEALDVVFFAVLAGVGDLTLAVEAIVTVAAVAADFVRLLFVERERVRLGGGGGGSSVPLLPFTFGITNASNRSTSPSVRLDI